MLAAALEAGRESEEFTLLDTRDRLDGGDRRSPLGEGAGLVDHKGVDLLEALEGFGVLDKHALAGASADADHNGHGRRQAERAGACDDQHRHRRHQSIGEARLRTDQRPDQTCEQRDGDDGGHEPARHGVGQSLDRGAAALRLGDHLDDARQQRVGAHLLGPHDE